VADRDIAVKFTGDATDLTRASDKAERSLADTGKSMGSSLSGLAGPAALAATAIAGIGFVAWDFADAAMEDEAAAAQLAHQLRQAAGASDEAVDGAERYIAALSKTVAIADDELRPALSTLATATGDTDKAQRLLALSTDIAAGTGKDLETVANAVAKAQLGNTGALGKLGIATKDATGETMSLDDVLSSAEEKFRGAGKAAAETSSGALKNAGIQMGELKEKIGEKLLPVLGTLGEIFTDKIIPAGEKLVKWAEEEWPKIWAKIEPDMIELRDTSKEVFDEVKKFWDEYGDEIIYIVTQVFLVWVEEMIIKLKIFLAITKWVIDEVKKFWAEYGDEIKWVAGIVADAMNTMQDIIMRVMAIIGWIIKATSAALSGDWGKAWDEMKAAVREAVDLAVDILKGLGRRAIDALKDLAGHLVAPFKTAFDKIVDLWNNTVGRIQVPSWVPGFGGHTFAAPTAGALGATPMAAPAAGGFAAASLTIIMPPGSDGYDVARQATTFSRNVAPINNLTIAVR
jgi:hypothetical protein